MSGYPKNNIEEINNGDVNYAPEKKETWVVVVAVLLILMLTVYFLLF